MNDENELSEVKEIIKATSELAKTIPVYEDALQPAMKQVGKSLETVAQTINIALAPISGIIWGYEQFTGFLQTTVAQKLSNIPIENIQSPEPTIVGPLFESLRYAGHINELREMYAKLLASSLNSKTSGNTHPSFVEIIKQLKPIEAIFLKRLSDSHVFPLICSSRDSQEVRAGSGYSVSEFSKNLGIFKEFNSIFDGTNPGITAAEILDNFLRLQLVKIDTITSQEISNNSHITLNQRETEYIELFELTITTEDSLIFTEFGINFIRCCVRNK